MIRKVGELLSRRWLRFPLSLVAAVLIFDAVGRAAADGVIPNWAAEETKTAQECTFLCPSGPAPTPGGGAPTPSGGGGDGGVPTPAPTPVPPQAVGGVGMGSWAGTPAPSSLYHYASIDASTGASVCPDPQNADWAPGVKAWMTQTAQPFNGFWFLRSLEWAQHLCTPAPTDAGNWGLLQAQQFAGALNAIDPLQRSLYLDAVFADLEWDKVPPYDSGTPCPTSSDNCSGALNYGYWYRDATHEAGNVLVIKGFFTALCNVYHFCNMGVYTTSSGWGDITNNAGPAATGGEGLVWLASWEASQGALNTQEQTFTSKPYVIYSWQFNRTTQAGTACFYPAFGYTLAQTEASNASPPIPRFDVWTNSNPNVVC